MSDGQQHGRTSFAQQGIWLGEQTRDMHDAYHAPCLISFDGELDTDALRTACDATIARHPVLTSAFEEEGGVPRMRPAERDPEIEVTDLSDLPPERAESRLTELIRHHALIPFDFQRGPLLRLVLCELAPERHALLLVTHHLVFDGPSIDIFTRDLVAFYQATLSGSAADLPEITHSFADYAAGEESRIAAVLPKAKRFWRKRWQEPEQMALPGVTGPIGHVGAANTIQFTIDAERRTALRRAGEAMGVTRFELLLASMYALLYRYGNSAPVITIALGLRSEEFQHDIGPFAQELPVAAPVEARMTFRQLATAVHEDLSELSPYRTVPLNRAITGVRPAALRTAVSISYRRSTPAFTLPGLKVRAERLPNYSARGAFWVLVFTEDDGMRFIINHPEETLSAESAERIADHWHGILDQAIAAPDTAIDALPVLSPAERGRLLLSWNPEAGTSQETVVDLFSTRAAAEPERTAARCGTAEMTYARLAADADGLARRLRCEGVAPGALVAVVAERSTETLTGLLAVLKNGGGYVLAGHDALADPAVRENVAAVLGERHSLDGLDGLTTVTLDSRGCACGGCATEDLPAPGPEDAAYATLTTGPDGLLPWFDHQALAGGLRAFGEILAIGPGDTLLALSPLAAPNAALELLLPLVTGAQVVIPDAEEFEDPARLAALAERHQVTHAQATPSTWQLLLDAGLDGAGVTAVSCGETLQPSLARRLRSRVRRLWNAHGTDDAALWSTCAEITPDAETVTIGRPVPGARVHLLDESGALVPIGSPGELCVAGPSLARGYAGDTAATAGRFEADPFGPPGSRLVRTGKRARHRSDGELEFLGGTHRRVKRHGQYVELADVETRLGAHPGVARCAVTTAEDGDGLLAYLLPSAGDPPPEDELARWLAGTLPAEQLPITYVALAEFPLTGDRRLDPSRLSPAGDGAGKGVERAEDVQDADLEAVARIWRDVLRLSAVGFEDNLFDFGVNSLIVTQISSRIYRRMGVDIPLEVFYDAPTITALCGVIAQARREE